MLRGNGLSMSHERAVGNSATRKGRRKRGVELDGAFQVKTGGLHCNEK